MKPDRAKLSLIDLDPCCSVAEPARRARAVPWYAAARSFPQPVTELAAAIRTLTEGRMEEGRMEQVIQRRMMIRELTQISGVAGAAMLGSTMFAGQPADRKSVR
jgi:hypothetical protein